MISNDELLQMALVGYQREHERLARKITEIQSQIDSNPPPQHGSAAVARRRTLSPEARERIAAAQRKRWAAARKGKRKKVA